MIEDFHWISKMVLVACRSFSSLVKIHVNIHIRIYAHIYGWATKKRFHSYLRHKKNHHKIVEDVIPLFCSAFFSHYHHNIWRMLPNFSFDILSFLCQKMERKKISPDEKWMSCTAWTWHSEKIKRNMNRTRKTTQFQNICFVSVWLVIVH